MPHGSRSVIKIFDVKIVYYSSLLVGLKNNLFLGKNLKYEFYFIWGGE